ncbi:MAG TPA: YggT family protein [Syntrophomonas sp.]|nr:YggT family protein [Syntrophomonas sp.]HRW13220.1 YggT family protein [Syntrophomonas sp.]
MSLYNIVNVMFEVYSFLIIAQVLMSWIPHDRYHPVFRFIEEITEPVLTPFRRLIPSVGGIDFSPIIALMALELVRRIILSLLAGF